MLSRRSLLWGTLALLGIGPRRALSAPASPLPGPPVGPEFATGGFVTHLTAVFDDRGTVTLVSEGAVLSRWTARLVCRGGSTSVELIRSGGGVRGEA